MEERQRDQEDLAKVSVPCSHSDTGKVFTGCNGHQLMQPQQVLAAKLFK